MRFMSGIYNLCNDKILLIHLVNFLSLYNEPRPFEFVAENMRYSFHLMLVF